MSLAALLALSGNNGNVREKPIMIVSSAEDGRWCVMYMPGEEPRPKFGPPPANVGLVVASFVPEDTSKLFVATNLDELTGVIRKCAGMVAEQATRLQQRDLGVAS